jgi:hypothetical protein
MSDREPIKPPEKNHPDDKVRTVVEAAVSVIPGGSGITKLMGDLAPTQAQKARGKWEHKVSDRTNENTDRLDNHDQLLTPKTTLAGGAVQLAVALAREPGNGMRGRGRSMDDLCELRRTLNAKCSSRRRSSWARMAWLKSSVSLGSTGCCT